MRRIQVIYYIIILILDYNLLLKIILMAIYTNFSNIIDNKRYFLLVAVILKLKYIDINFNTWN